MNWLALGTLFGMWFLIIAPLMDAICSSDEKPWLHRSFRFTAAVLFLSGIVFSIGAPVWWAFHVLFG